MLAIRISAAVPGLALLGSASLATEAISPAVPAARLARSTTGLVAGHVRLAAFDGGDRQRVGAPGR